MTIGIVGGGIMGVSVGYFLARRGLPVEIFEASPTLGGLAGPLLLPDGTPIDRFYHAILSSDTHLRQLCAELGIEDQLRFRQTRMGFYHDGQIVSMNSTLELLRFPPLHWIDRFRLGLTVLAAQFIRDWRRLEAVSVEDWLVRWGGRRAFESIWRPLLRAKFDGGFDGTPATYIWARLVRMKSTRGGASQREEAGHLIGGYATLLRAMAEKIEAAGGRIHLGTPVQEIVVERGQAIGLRVSDEVRPFETIISTMQAPVFRRLIPAANPSYLEYLGRMRYLGIVCPVLVLDRPLSGYWTLNITDPSVPFTGVIETTSYIEPRFVGGHHLVYLPKYTLPESPLQKVPDGGIRAMWLEDLRRMFPAFDPASVRYFLVHRERLVEPLHGLNEAALIPEIETPITNLFLSTTAQIYPGLTNGESVTRHASRTAELVWATAGAHAAGPEKARLESNSVLQDHLPKLSSA
jgi:protoporphyrinogen oxidase